MLRQSRDPSDGPDSLASALHLTKISKPNRDALRIIATHIGSNAKGDILIPI